MRYQRSSTLFKEAQQVIPGGVNSPVRAFKSVGGTPIFVEKAKGAYLYDVDGNSYLDYISSWGPMILGHAFAPVIEAVKKRADRGTSFGIPTELETEIARLALQMIPNMDKIRFVNSGTEACMSAVRLARGATQREKIIKFKGCYHGHSDAFLIQAGSGAVTFGSPSSPGVTAGTAKDTLLADYNNLTEVEQLFQEYPEEIAAIIVEPVAGNMGCIPPAEGFLEGLRALCDQYTSLLIFDEVMTGFRLAKGGAQELLGVKADIVTYGKVLGGGLPVGAFAAKKGIMKYLAPEGPVYQAGTLSGNPLAMAAGLAMLQALDADPQIYTRLAEKTERLELGLNTVLENKGIPYQINRLGSMISLHFTEQPVIDFETAAKGDNERFNSYFHGMLNEGIYLPPSAFESYFLNDALSLEDIDKTIHSFQKVAQKL
ncbi:glutamate-1-semialdehyde 2,1-aminomutase [Flavobacteriaceae bacterium]|jgi:glutamate-1-semialdehyde 2,1-aminomutase|nr:glutamate-1-semialdehyde 2,1-aminomutase [Flavobacteriaceae bacterium]MDA9187699.1 glutamate-1-semialdehyde 2,1-aminomutase [Flavobacteriaceae bacterium]MDC3330372.1 glutamate-1-semialdehyde 2,1-aminomutase [Flavobacteriaceae bacterium]